MVKKWWLNAQEKPNDLDPNWHLENKIQFSD